MFRAPSRYFQNIVWEGWEGGRVFEKKFLSFHLFQKFKNSKTKNKNKKKFEKK